MEKIPLPAKIDIQPGQKRNESIVSIQPCFPGYGTTMGNALRRVMLSSLPGAAVTAFKIKGASHEFAALPFVKEDLVEVSLNLKQLRMKVFSDQPVRLELKVKGEKKVTAKDIKTSSDVEIVNPELLIATLTGKDAELEMELLVSQGRGYVPTESKEKENLETDMIMIDSIFTPVVNVGFSIEHVRVGQITNYENLILTIETDGSINPAEALRQSNQVLIEHFNFVAEEVSDSNTEKTASIKAETTEDSSDTSEETAESEEKAEKKVRKTRKKAEK